jgi:hypothetical protein
MIRVGLIWLLMGALGLVGYDAYRSGKAPKRGEVHTMEGGNGYPPPP